MSKDSKSGIVASGLDNYLSAEKQTYKLRRQEIERQLKKPRLSEQRRTELEDELAELERDWKEKRKNAKFSLF